MTMAKHHSVVHHLRTYGIAGLLALGSGSAFASSFGLIDQSVSSMGSAYATGSSGIDDASTVYFNPAGMARLHGSHLSGGLHIIDLNTDFKGSAEYNLPGSPLDGASIDGKRKDDLDTTEVVPHGYIAHQYSDKVWFGLGVNAPFGLKTDYDSKWVGRYQAIKSELLTININPSIAFRFNDNVSLGFGLSALYADGELTNKADGGLGLAAVPPELGGPLGAPGSDDGRVKLTGDDWGYGFNAGILLEPTQNTRIGLHYRSEVDLTLDGHVKVSGFSHPVLASNNGRQSAKMDITLPDNVSLSGTYKLNTRWAFMGDVTWTNWSDIDKLVTKLNDGSRSVAVWDYDDSWRYSIGTEFSPSRTWTFRTGVAYDETPVPRDSLRSPRVPDNDRTWLTLGLTYRYTPNLSFDFGYAHIFVDDPKLKNVSDNHDPTEGQTTGVHSLSGKYDASVDILSAQVNWRFR
jgi:long-chain fatty acid transport protein